MLAEANTTACLSRGPVTKRVL